MRLVVMALVAVPLAILGVMGVAFFAYLAMVVAVVLAFVEMAWEAGNVAGAAEQLQRDPVVKQVDYELDGFLGNYISVKLQPSATDADARAVWCEVLVAKGIADTASVFASKGRDWNPPQDCSDPLDIPEPRRR